MKDLYLDYINKKLPEWSKNNPSPVKYNHCFARIVLDNVFNDVWYNHLKKPAYKNIKEKELSKAIAICENILNGKVDIFQMNKNSLKYRSKLK